MSCKFKNKLRLNNKTCDFVSRDKCNIVSKSSRREHFLVNLFQVKMSSFDENLVRGIYPQLNYEDINPPAYSAVSHHVAMPPAQQVFSVTDGQLLSTPYLTNLDLITRERADCAGTRNMQQVNFIQCQGIYFAKIDINKMSLSETYPTCYVVFHSIFMILVALSQISIQYVLVVNKSYYMFITGGWYSGGLLMACGLLSLLTGILYIVRK